MNILSLTRALAHRCCLTAAPVLLVLTVFLLLAGTVCAEPIHPSAANFTSVRNDWLARMRQAGLRGDRSQIHYMVEAFQNPPGEDSDVSYAIRLSLLRPLAQLGATEALPALEDVIQSDPKKPLPGQTYADLWENQEIIASSKAVKARILAQSATQGMTDGKARAAALVRQFYQELGHTPDTLNAAVAAYEAQNKRHLQASRLDPDVLDNAVPVELCAVRELADMAYHDRYRGFTSLPDVARVDFAQDAGAALKVRLAPLSRGQRVAALVEEISQEKIGDGQVVRRAQLLVDEGPSALPVIAAKQQDFKAHREQYREKLGGHFGGLSILIKRRRTSPPPLRPPPSRKRAAWQSART